MNTYLLIEIFEEVGYGRTFHPTVGLYPSYIILDERPPPSYDMYPLMWNYLGSLTTTCAITQFKTTHSSVCKACREIGKENATPVISTT